MRVSPIGFIAKDLYECKKLSRMVTEITHNHPEGLKRAEAIAVCVWLARTMFKYIKKLKKKFKLK